MTYNFRRSLCILAAGLMLTTAAQAQQSFSLAEAQTYAQSNHNATRLQQIAVARAEQDIKEFKAIGMPKVDAGVDYSYYFQPPQQPVQDFIGPSVYGILFQEGVIPERDLGDPRVFELGFVQPHNLTGKIQASGLLFSGSYIYGLRAAKLYKDLVQTRGSSTDQMIKADVTKAYMAALIAIRNKGILQNNITTIDKSLSEVQSMFDAGFAERLDVDRLQITSDKLHTELSKLDQYIEVSKNVLKYQMGYPIQDDIDLSENIESLEQALSIEQVDLEADIDFDQRAEYATIAKGQEINELNLKVNKAGYLPTASAFVSHQQALLRNDLFDNNEAGWIPTTVAGININVPIYDGGDKSAKIQKVRLDIEKTNIEKENFERAMTLQVQNARMNYVNAKASLDQAKKSMEMTESIYNKTKIKFSEGVGNSVEVTQAEGQWFEAQGDYINALFDLLTAKTDLDIATGRL